MLYVKAKEKEDTLFWKKKKRERKAFIGFTGEKQGGLLCAQTEGTTRAAAQCFFWHR